VHSAGARAALQLQSVGKTLGAGQVVRYLRIRGEPDVLAWDLALQGRAFAPDNEWYAESLVRAAHEVLQSFGISRELVADWLAGRTSYYRPEDFVAAIPDEMPLLNRVVR